MKKSGERFQGEVIGRTLHHLSELLPSLSLELGGIGGVEGDFLAGDFWGKENRKGDW
jgi:hypothetical protein